MEVQVKESLQNRIATLASKFSVPSAVIIETAVEEWFELHEVDFKEYEASRQKMAEALQAHEAALSKVHGMFKAQPMLNL